VDAPALTPEEAAEAHAAAIRTMQDIRDAFGFQPLDEPETSALVPFIERGSLVYDPKAEALEFRLSAPLKLKNGEKMEFVKFREATALELEYIRGASSVYTNGGVNLGQWVDMTIRALVKTGDLAVGIGDRIKARDVDALKDIMVELGFFGR